MENALLYPLPAQLPPNVEIVPADALDLDLPMAASYVAAGFPSPADDYIEDKANLQRLLISNPPATYLVRVRGNSMEDAQLHDGDILVVDRSLQASEGQIIIGLVESEFTVKRLVRLNEKLYLQPANKQFDPLELNEAMDFKPWGVVVWSLHKIKLKA